MLNDMGHKCDEPCTAMPAGEKGKKSYPGFSISQNIPKDLADKEVGHVCRIEMVVKITGKSERDDNETLDFEIQKMGYKAAAGKIDEKEYMGKSQKDREEYDREQMEDEDDKEK